MEDNDRIILSLLIEVFGEPKHFDISNEKEQWEFNCPSSYCKHDYEKYNLSYNAKMKIFNCWKCGSRLGTKGYVHKLVKKYGTKSQYDRLNLILPEHSTNLIDVFNKPKVDHALITCKLPQGYHPLNKFRNTPLYKKAYDYITIDRKVNKLIIDKFKIGYTEEGSHRNRIIIPSFNNANKLNYFEARAFLNVKPPYLKPSSPDKELIIFNESFINWDLPIYLVEGPFDMIRIPNSIPLLGKTLSDLLIRQILQHNSKVILCLDADAVMEGEATYKMLSSLGVDVYFVDLTGKNDISWNYENYGMPAIVELLKTVKKLDINFSLKNILKS